MDHLKLFANAQVLLLTVGVTIFIEVLTLLGRFLIGIRAISDTPVRLQKLTFGYRLHHGYLGLGGLFMAGMIWSVGSHWLIWLMIGSIALLASDFIHHFCILWPMTGDHEFFLCFPD